MARTANETREKLITIGQRLFAEQGVFRVPLRLVIDQAGQKNTSALHYHFGGREGLLMAIIERHNSSIEIEREGMLDEIQHSDEPVDITTIARAFVLPFARKLDSVDGREYLRVVVQLSDLFDFWDEGPPAPVQARAALLMMAEAIPDLPAAVRHERVTTVLMLVCNALALRARQIDLGRELHISTDVFIGNLVDMTVGLVQAKRASSPA